VIGTTVIGTTSTTAAGTGWRSRCAYGSGMADEESGRLERAIGGGVDLLGKLAGASMGLVSPDARRWRVLPSSW
jgi:hypothetical protein